MATITTISVEPDDLEFVKMRGLSPSKIYRTAICRLREGDETDELKKKIKSWAYLFNFARVFIDEAGLRVEF